MSDRLHFELLTEEPSMEAFLNLVLPKLIADRASYNITVYQGKHDLLRKLPLRLKGYARFIPANYRIVVLVDRDQEDCKELKSKLEQIASSAKLRSKTAHKQDWQVANRIVIEELEAWYFGQWSAVKTAFPKVSEKIPFQAAYRYPDNVQGGTWEALERILKTCGYYSSGLSKLDAAQKIGVHFNVDNVGSKSFKCFRDLFN